MRKCGNQIQILTWNQNHVTSHPNHYGPNLFPPTQPLPSTRERLYCTQYENGNDVQQIVITHLNDS